MGWRLGSCKVPLPQTNVTEEYPEYSFLRKTCTQHWQVPHTGQESVCDVSSAQWQCV